MVLASECSAKEDGSRSGWIKCCYGTGRLQGKFSGPGWPECPYCSGKGKVIEE